MVLRRPLNSNDVQEERRANPSPFSVLFFSSMVDITKRDAETCRSALNMHRRSDRGPAQYAGAFLFFLHVVVCFNIRFRIALKKKKN